MWRDLTVPLLAYIREKPRSIDEIVFWGRGLHHSGSRIRHMLAYLSFHGFVDYDASASRWKIIES